MEWTEIEPFLGVSIMFLFLLCFLLCVVVFELLEIRYCFTVCKVGKFCNAKELKKELQIQELENALAYKQEQETLKPVENDGKKKG